MGLSPPPTLLSSLSPGVSSQVLGINPSLLLLRIVYLSEWSNEIISLQAGLIKMVSKERNPHNNRFQEFTWRGK